MGTPAFAVPSLTALVEADYTPVAVATGPDRPRGRGQEVTPTPVKTAAQEAGIDRILQPEDVTDPAFAEAVAEVAPDVIAVVAYKILPPEVFTAARKGAFNLHGSLLPKYRGAAPINHAIMAGDPETGVTTFFLEPSVDTGDIILQARMSIGPNETAGSVHDRMAELGADAVVETVRQLDEGTVETRPQDDDAATPTTCAASRPTPAPGRSTATRASSCTARGGRRGRARRARCWRPMGACSSPAAPGRWRCSLCSSRAASGSTRRTS
jgi:methionyl-tRNA formyltransferase